MLTESVTMKMNKIFKILAAALACVAVCGCDRNDNIGDDAIRINVGLQKETLGTKVAMSPSVSGLALAWEDGDEIRIIGSDRSSLFGILPGFSEHSASFEGTQPGDAPYTVIFPGKYASIAELDAKDCTSQIQASNGDASHLEYNAVLSGVTSVENFAFSPEWASSSNVDILQNAVLHLVADLPAGIEAVNSAVLRANTEIFPAVNSGSVKTDALSINLEKGSIVPGEALSLWFNIGWAGFIIPEKTEFTLVIQTNIGEYAKSFTPAPVHIVGGYLYTMKVNDARWRSGSTFAGGDGTQTNPYLISNYVHMKNIVNVISEEKETFFRMTEDVDMDPSYAGYWIPLNETTPYGRKVDFDGDGHTIRNLTVNGAFQHCGLFAVLYGCVHDVTFENVVITDTYNPSGTNHDVGVVCGYGGYKNNGIQHTASVNNVTIRNCEINTRCTVRSGSVGFGSVAGTSMLGSFIGCVSQNVKISCKGSQTCNIIGGAIGRITGKTSLSGMTASEVSIEGYSYLGGLVGYVNTSDDVLIENCSSSGSVNGFSYLGGILGATGKCPVTITRCGSSANVKGSSVRLGGIVGSIGDNTTSSRSAISHCSFNGTVEDTGNETSNTNKYIGGIAGVTYNTVVTLCRSAAILRPRYRTLSTAGVVGYASRSDVSRCQWEGTFAVKDAQVVAGIVATVMDRTTVCNNVSLGDVSGSYTVGGVFGIVNTGNYVQRVSDNYVSGNVRGVGAVGTIGGRYGVSNSESFTVDGNLAYADSVVSDRTGTGSRSAGAIIGECDGSGYVLYDNYRSSLMVFIDGTASCNPRFVGAYDQAGTWSNSRKLDWSGYNVGAWSMYHPYHGASSSSSASSMAYSMDWNTSFWDFSSGVPKLKELPDFH